MIMEAATLTSVLTDLGSVFNSLMGYVGKVFETIQTYPIALIPVGVAIAFIAVRFAKNVLSI